MSLQLSWCTGARKAGVQLVVPKFVAMATGVVRGEIQMTPSDIAGPKIGGRCKQRAIFLR